MAGPSELEAFFAGDFGDGAFRGEISLEYLQVTGGFQRILHGTYDLLSRLKTRQVLHILLQSFAGHRHAVAMQQLFGDQHFVDCGQASDRLQIFHHIRTAGLEVSQQRGLVADVLEVVDAERDVHRARHRDEVQHGIGRSAQCSHNDHCILKCFTRHDVARF